MLLRILSVLLICSLLVSGVSADSGINACLAPNAQGATPEAAAPANACIPPDAITAAQAACASIDVGQGCLGAGEVQGLTTVGEAVDLSTIDSLTGTSGSLALLKMLADLPDGAEPLELVLYGAASLSNAFTALPQPLPTVTLQNAGFNILNLRATPSLSGTVVGTMMPNDELTADGRSSDGTWLRVQREQGTAWIYASLVTVKEGDDAAKLIATDSPITQKFQSLKLESAAESCAGGLLVESANSMDAHLEINGALLTFASATLLLQAQADTALNVQVIKGTVDLAASGESLAVKAGSTATVALSGTQVSAAPQLVDNYSFSMLSSAPLSFLPQAASACVAGVTSGTAASLYRTPGASQSSAELNADNGALVTGQTKTSDGKIWYLLGSNWISADDVALAGYCESIPEVSASAAQQSVSLPAASFAHDQLPDGRSIWQAHTGVDNLTGVCTAPPIAQCDHLAAVTAQPNGTITWLGQEPAPYTLRPSGDNTFSYRGRNQLNNANLSLTVTFTGPTTWVGTMHIVYDSDSGCTHTFNYTADRMR
ncbi:MAG: SH3 domain-containing protein [Chloroflexi bacterium]|nr:SH3 domain-containing protein [Chloroflexota bacterium]